MIKLNSVQNKSYARRNVETYDVHLCKYKMILFQQPRRNSYNY